MPIRCFVHFAQVHPEFRLPELESVSELFGFRFNRPEPNTLPDGDCYPVVWDASRPFWIIDFDEEEHAKRIAERCILVK